jgi:hypothetical protein
MGEDCLPDAKFKLVEKIGHKHFIEVEIEIR